MGSEEDPADALARLSLAESFPCSKLAAKPPPCAYDHMITIVITDEDDCKFHVYHGVLCFYSEYFKKMLDGPFKEGGSTCHVLNDVTYDVYHMFYSWMNTGTVMDSLDSTDADLSSEDLVQIYAFADFYMVEQLKNRILELVFMKMLKDWAISTDVTSLMYEKTTHISLLRKLHVDICIETSGFANLRDQAQNWPQDFVIDLLVGYKNNKTVPGAGAELQVGRVAWIQKMVKVFCSKYHEHGEPERRLIVKDLTTKVNSESNAGHSRGTLDNMTCYNCSERGHFARNCPEPKDWRRVTCRHCGKKGHASKERCEVPSEGGWGSAFDDDDSGFNTAVQTDGGWGTSW